MENNKEKVFEAVKFYVPTERGDLRQISFNETRELQKMMEWLWGQHYTYQGGWYVYMIAQKTKAECLKAEYTREIHHWETTPEIALKYHISEAYAALGLFADVTPEKNSKKRANSTSIMCQKSNSIIKYLQ